MHLRDETVERLLSFAQYHNLRRRGVGALCKTAGDFRACWSRGSWISCCSLGWQISTVGVGLWSQALVSTYPWSTCTQTKQETNHRCSVPSESQASSYAQEEGANTIQKAPLLARTTYAFRGLTSCLAVWLEPSTRRSNATNPPHPPDDR